MRIPPCGNYGDIDGDGYVTRESRIWGIRHIPRMCRLYIPNDQDDQSFCDGCGCHVRDHKDYMEIEARTWKQK
jgi:hypothetical protein